MDNETLARTLALGDGIGPLTWAAQDECVRLHYRREAAKLRPIASTDPAPCFQERKSSEPPIQKSASGLQETDTASRRE